MEKLRQGKKTARPGPGLAPCELGSLLHCVRAHAALRAAPDAWHTVGQARGAPVTRSSHAVRQPRRFGLFPGAVGPEGRKTGRGGRACRGDRGAKGGLGEGPRGPRFQRSAERDFQAQATTSTTLRNDTRPDRGGRTGCCPTAGRSPGRPELALGINGNCDILLICSPQRMKSRPH